MFRRPALRLVLLASLSTLCGCPNGKGPKPPRPRRAVTGGGVLRIRIPNEPSGLPCLLSQNVWCDRMLLHTVYEPLVRYNPRTRKFEGALAVGWKQLDGGRTFQLQLRKEVTWHNGQKFTSRDVKHSLSQYIGHSYRRLPPARLLSQHVAQLTYPTKHLFEIQFKKPFGPILEVLAALPIQPAPKTLGKPEETTSTASKVVGTGPYRFLQWWEGEKIVIARNTKYWGTAGRLRRIEFYPIRSLSLALQRIQKSKLDLVTDLGAREYRDALSKLGSTAHPVSVEPAEFAMIALNLRKPPFKEVRLRQALARLIDRRKLVQAMPGGRPRLIEQPVWHRGPQAAAARGTGPRLDSAGGGRLLDAAGWKRTPGKKYRQNKGRLLEVEITTAERFTAFNRGLRVLRDDLARAGIKLIIRKVLWGRLVQILARRQFQAIALAVPLGGPWHSLNDLLHSSHMRSGGNHAGFKAKAMDDLLKRLVHELRPIRRQAIQKRIFQLVSREAPFIPLFAPRRLGISRVALADVHANYFWFDLTRIRVK